MSINALQRFALDDALGLPRGTSNAESLRSLIGAWSADRKVAGVALSVLLRDLATTLAEGQMPDLPHVRGGGAGGLHVLAEGDPRVELVAAAQKLVATRGVTFTEAISAARDADAALDERVVRHYVGVDDQ